jgi:hypothetical protein
MDQAWSILDEQITLALDQLRRVEERGANECLDLLGWLSNVHPSPIPIVFQFL